MLYVAEGLVFGLCGGQQQQVVHRAKKLYAENRLWLYANLQNALNDGSFGEGLNFNHLTGAVLRIEAIDTIESNGRKYINSSYSIATFGSITDEQYWYAMAAFDKF